MYRAALVALALIATTSAASAHHYDRESRIEFRQALQEYQIDKARNAGELTRFENDMLQYQQYHIWRMQQRALRDGRISWWEARRIEREQNLAARSIYRQSHDGDRPWWGR
jgi:hypothetical protein